MTYPPTLYDMLSGNELDSLVHEKGTTILLLGMRTITERKISSF